jgi:DAACS family dicarboxylate/amino acid:cation (Na+ or H+) symporter
VLVTVGVPAEGIGVILGVDRFLDMCRTVINVVGDLVVAVVIAAWERRSTDDATAAVGGQADRLPPAAD